MTNGNNAAQGKHLESLATATKRYILAQILDVTDAVSSELENASGSGVLDTIPATVNGGMWYELDSGVPRYIKLKHGDHTLSLTPSIVSISPNLTVTPAATTVPGNGSITATVSYLGTGTITVSGSDGVTPTYNASTKVVTVPYSVNTHTATITVSLGASYGYLAETATFNVTMDNVSPNLTVTYLPRHIEAVTDEWPFKASVSYLGNGTVSVSADNENIHPTYDSSTKIISVPFYHSGGYAFSYNLTVTVSPSGNYSGESVTIQGWNSHDGTIRIMSPNRVNRDVFYPTDNDVFDVVPNCGWQVASGTPSISNDLIFTFDGSTCLYKPDFYLGGQDIVTTFRLRVDCSYTECNYAHFFDGPFGICNFYDCIRIKFGSTVQYNNKFKVTVGEWRYLCIIYRHEEQTLTLYIDGDQAVQLASVSIPRTAYTIRLGGNAFDQFGIGAIWGLRLWEGVPAVLKDVFAFGEDYSEIIKT